MGAEFSMILLYVFSLLLFGWGQVQIQGTSSISLSHFSQQQQLQAQHLSHGHALPVPLTPHPSGLPPPTIPSIGSSAGLLALSSALGGQSHLPIKDEKKHHDSDHQRGEPFSVRCQSDITYLLLMPLFVLFLSGFNFTID